MKHTVTLITGLMVALSVPAVAGTIVLVNDTATDGPGRFAAEEIRRQAVAHGMTLRDDANAIRISITVFACR